jgi:hypothetical protein
MLVFGKCNDELLNLYVWEAAAAFFDTSLCLLSSCCFFPNSYLPSPLLSFVLPMMKLSKIPT